LKEKIAGIKGVVARFSKESRARAITPEVESGNVYLPHPTDPGNEWVADLLSELRNFPHDVHDDQVDALTQALMELRDSARGGITVPGRVGPNSRIAPPRSITQAARSDLSRRR
jgi:phage terminase large subunit-like protein